MKYIGSFFRMNSISPKEIESQLLYFTRESLNHIILDSKCGVPISQKMLKKTLSDSEYNKIKEMNPIIAIYKKAKPNIYYSKHSKLWDESSFKKDILISSNALMTLSLLKLSTYYKSFKNIDDKLFSLSKTYLKIAKIQLDFYYEKLRNNEGFFIDKRNTSTSNTSFPDLIDIDQNFSFSDQAFMMCAYYAYSKATEDNKECETFRSFALEILEMFNARKDFLYDENIEECSKICYAFNNMYSMSKNIKCKTLLLDMSDFILSKYLDYGIDEKDMSLATLTAINLYQAYNNTGILTFKESFYDICKLFKSLYNDELSTFIKASDKKDVKYYNIEIILYLVNLMLYNKNDSSETDLDDTICNFFKNSLINSDIITSFPTPPNLDCVERYKHFSNKSTDLLDDLMFSLPDITTPELSSLAPVYLKSTTYSKKKGCYSTSKMNFESYNNMFINFLILDLFSDDYMKFIAPIPRAKNSSSKSDNRKNKPFRNSSNKSEVTINEPQTIKEENRPEIIKKTTPSAKSLQDILTVSALPVDKPKTVVYADESNIIDVKILKDDLSTINYEEIE